MPRERNEHTMQENLSFDKLTATYTSKVFKELVPKFIGKKPFQGILLVDIDDLKYMNRTKSREVGDALITLIVRNIYNNIPKNSIVGRAGDDEFAIFLPDLKDFDELSEIAQKLVKIHKAPIIYNNEEYIQTISIGVLKLNEEIDIYSGIEALLNLASVALNVSKMDGRNRVAEFKHESLKIIDRKAYVLNALKHSIEKETFTVNYQPLFSMRSGDLIAFEALCRMTDENDESIVPDEFIKIAEENNIIWSVDRCVLKNACKTLEMFKRNGILIRISINISAKSILRPNFLCEFRDIFDRADIFRGSLLLELTETAFIESFANVKDIIEEFNRCGIKFLLDDFGVGYSNFLTLQQLDIDILKLDKMLIENILELKSNVIVKKTIEIADVFNMEALAEGVETQLQFDELKKLNCAMGQGFLFGKPMLYEELLPFIKENKNILETKYA